MAIICAGRIPDSIMKDEEVLSKLPILLRTLEGQKLDETQLKNLIEAIKTS